MYLYTTKRKDKNGAVVEYLQLCRSYRDSNGKSKREVLANLGRKDYPETFQELESFAAKLTGAKTTKDLINFVDNEVTLEWSKIYGLNIVFRKLWDDLKLNEIFAGKFNEHIFLMALNRLCDPTSKLDCLRWKEMVYEPLWDDIQLHELYRALDWLIDNKERTEYQIFNNVKDLFNQNTDLMLFDTTSVGYWGKGDHAPKLLKHGYSKEKRNDLKQLIVALLMTDGGIPVGHEVYPGNQVDVTTFPLIISKVKEKFKLNRVVWICDRGMISDSNMKLLEEIKNEYIIGVKMRMLDSAKRQVLLNKPFKEFRKVHNNLYVSEVFLGEKRYVVCFNPKQAQEDSINRDRFKKIIQDKVLHSTNKSWIMKNGYKKYLKLKEDIIESIDYEKLEKEKIYDGKWVLVTNTKLEYTEIAKYYKSLWQIENAFKELKSSIDVKPMYHWTEKRIRGHIFICFIALVLELGFKNKLIKISYSEAMEDLKKLQVSLLKVRNDFRYKRTKLIGTTPVVFEQLKIPIPDMNIL